VKLVLPEELGADIARSAKSAFPSECCGLVEGSAEKGGFRATRLHPARNLADAPDRFEIDPVDHIAAVKSARLRGANIIGCYHSHPGGEATPSNQDLARAGEENFLWLIAATDGTNTRLAGYVYGASGFTGLDLGAD
jgi:proteasome lid subunit RPN8/RPN11